MTYFQKYYKKNRKRLRETQRRYAKRRRDEQKLSEPRDQREAVQNDYGVHHLQEMPVEKLSDALSGILSGKKRLHYTRSK